MAALQMLYRLPGRKRSRAESMMRVRTGATSVAVRAIAAAALHIRRREANQPIVMTEASVPSQTPRFN
jgi:hypothetical protein